MDRQVRCECGYVARGETDDDVIALVLEHVRQDHPGLSEGPEDVRGCIEFVS